MADETAPADQSGLTDEQADLLHRCFDMARAGESQHLLTLVDHGLPVDLADHKGDTLLALAAYNARTDLVRGLLERGANPNLVNDRGQTALACALFVQDGQAVTALLTAGADPALGSMPAWQVVDMFGLDAMREFLPPR